MGSLFSKDKRNKGGSGASPNPSSSSTSTTLASSSSSSSAQLLFGFRNIPPGAIVWSSEVAGKGATATVRRGDWKGTPVAIKVMFTDDIEAFEKEVRALSQVGPHPCVLEVLGIGKERTTHYIVTQFISKGNLGEWMKNRGKDYNWDLVLLMAMDICRGMLHIHEAGMLHRDLKPSNLLVSSFSMSEDDVRIKICDFGIARERREKMTSAIGTPIYMAPEMYTRNYSGQVDVFAFGLILLEMLTGIVPYAEVPIFGITDAIMRGDRPKIPEYIPEILRDLITKCWAGNPDDRPPFDQILAVLRQAYAEKDTFTPLNNE